MCSHAVQQTVMTFMDLTAVLKIDRQHTHTEKNTDRQTDIQIERQTDRRSVRQTQKYKHNIFLARVPLSLRGIEVFSEFLPSVVPIYRLLCHTETLPFGKWEDGRLTTKKYLLEFGGTYDVCNCIMDHTTQQIAACNPQA